MSQKKIKKSVDKKFKLCIIVKVDSDRLDENKIDKKSKNVKKTFDKD